MPFVQIEKQHLRLYRILQGTLYFSTALLLVFLILRSLFPITLDSFNFENPSAKDNSLIPSQHSLDTENIRSLKKNQSIIFNLGASAEDTKATFHLLIDKKSPLPKDLHFQIRHGYEASWLPEGAPLSDFPAIDFYVADGVYYQRIDEHTLERFVSKAAFLSRYPEEFAQPRKNEEIASYSLSEKVIGFRPGVLTAYGEGVFIIMNDTEMRPVGSARIFQDLGFRFEDVQKISAEELGMYDRGKIFLSGDRHPDGTLFKDADTSRYFLIDQEQLHEVLPGRYLDFLLSKTRPVLYSTQTSLETASCQTTPDIFTHGVHCTMAVDAVSATIGSNYEIKLTNTGDDTHLRFLEARFTTAKNSTNLHFILAQIKDSFLTRFGLN